MAQHKIHIDVRSPATGISILDIQGGISGSAEEALFAAYNEASNDARAIILNLSEVPAIDSLGAGLLIALLARVRKQGQRPLAYGLSEHCRRAFELTHLDEVVGLFRDEAEAMGSI
jgi:anti-anti-sigma factor